MVDCRLFWLDLEVAKVTFSKKARKKIGYIASGRGPTLIIDLLDLGQFTLMPMVFEFHCSKSNKILFLAGPDAFPELAVRTQANQERLASSIYTEFNGSHFRCF